MKVCILFVLLQLQPYLTIKLTSYLAYYERLSRKLPCTCNSANYEYDDEIIRERVYSQKRQKSMTFQTKTGAYFNVDTSDLHIVSI